MRSANTNPELTAPIDLCLPSGALDPRARGHSRRPLHRPNLRGFGRTKRWEYWGIVTETHVIGLTLSSLDYLALHECFVLDRARGVERKHGCIVPFGLGASLPDTLPPLTATARGPRLDYRFADEPGGTRLRARASGVEVDVFVEDAGDALGVVVPFDEKTFQYTVKSPARPVSGVLRLDGVEHAIAPGRSWAVLDRGRGRWPYHIVWNWAAGSGVVDGVRIGLQLGGKWTVGSGATENALFVDGVMHYIPAEATWTYDTRAWDRPWRMENARVDVTLTPFHVRHAGLDLGVLGSEVDLCGPTAMDLHILADELGLHELAVEDALGEHQRPKVDYYATHLFFACKAVTMEAGGTKLVEKEIDAFIGARWLITVRKHEDFSMTPVIGRWDRSPDLAKHGVSYLLYGLLDVVVDGYFDAIEVFDTYYDDVSEGIFADTPLDPSKQKHWFAMRQALVRFHRIALPMREAISGLMRREHTAVAEAMYPYFQDVYDHVLRVTEATDSLRDLVSTIVETNLSLRDYRQNLIMKKVTSWAAIVAVPTLITGYYGMNIPFPGFGQPSAVITSAALLVVCTVGLYITFKRKGWL